MAREFVVGIDFAGPAKARAQRRKILAVAAERTGKRRYTIRATGFNARLLGAPPGWTAEELADELARAKPTPSVVAADFPFCVPQELLENESFAAGLGFDRAFADWRTFNSAVCGLITLGCPIDYKPFLPWRQKTLWRKRASDRVSGAHAPLKDRFQVLFNMTLLGNAFLSRLVLSGKYDVVPFQSRRRAEVIEIYPGHAMRALGVPNYKRAPAQALDTVIQHLKDCGVLLELDSSIRDACLAYNSGGKNGSDYDAADAVVAVCIAALRRENLAREVVGTPAGARDVEGAIWSVPMLSKPERRRLE